MQTLHNREVLEIKQYIECSQEFNGKHHSSLEALSYLGLKLLNLKYLQFVYNMQLFQFTHKYMVGVIDRNVPVNKLLLAGTVPVNKLLLARTVPVNKLLLSGTPLH